MDNIKSKIGAICINFESLDLMLSICIGRLISTDSKIGAIITTDLSFGNLCNAFSSLIKYKFNKDSEFINEVSKLIAILNESESKRNQVIHSAYYFKDFENNKNNVGRIKITAKQRKGLNIDINDITEEDLKEINNKIVFAIDGLNRLYSSLFPGETLSYA